MVSFAKSGDHFPFDETAAVCALGTESVLVVASAIVIAILAKESSLGQRIGTHSALEALDMKVLVLHSKHLARALLLASLTLRLTCNKRKGN